MELDPESTPSTPLPLAEVHQDGPAPAAVVTTTAVNPRHSVAIQRLIDEVRQDNPNPAGAFDRCHNRHNRS